jgi:GTP pyrophosphokinase
MSKLDDYLEIAEIQGQTESVHAEALVVNTKAFAKKKHAGQVRRDGSPYFNHPKRVAKIASKNKKSKHLAEIVSAGYLHDSIEDTDATIEELEKLYGTLVSSIVSELTSDKSEVKRLGKTKYLTQKMLGMTNYSLYLKLCDRLDNVSDLHTTDEVFRNKYIKETNEIIKQLSDNRKLTDSQQKILNKIRKKLAKFI